ncbi:Dabb family protein [Frigoribacterium sp. VKM Ac-2836]|uniref:Dabb family protein n=1 Tax=Frigoribacterium sp. VKM Ac-2836 TaxID=2739014 RepID=UPI001566FA57|nr:Dabb family protein [Frigoribacterium sp. VKM Ac-2836]NRD26330.1 Dabb family protein [Frigoribacterium sp. VKM Ac-2836]
MPLDQRYDDASPARESARPDERRADAHEIVHVVLVEWSETAPADASEQASRLSTEHLTGIDGVLSVSSGESVSPEQLEAGFDWMLVVRFRDTAARDGYLPHPSHLPVASHLRDASARVVVFDVEA